MDVEALETRLARGEQWGFQKIIDDSQYLGWILLVKRQPPILYERAAYTGAEEKRYAELVKLARKLKKTPYQILNLELRREVHENGDYETEEDYRFRQSLYFENLQEVERFISSLGYSLNDIKHRRDLDAP